MTLDQHTTEVCAICGCLVETDDAVYKLTLPEGMTRDEMRELGWCQAGKYGARLETICKTCRDQEAER